MRNLSTRKKIKNGVYRPLSSRLNPQKNTETKILPTVLNIYMRYWPGVSSKWLNISQVICCVFYRPRPCRGQQKRQKRPTTSHLDFTQGQQKTYYIVKKRTLSSGTRAGPILPARVANRNTGFASPCLLEDSTTDVKLQPHPRNVIPTRYLKRKAFPSSSCHEVCWYRPNQEGKQE